VKVDSNDATPYSKEATPYSKDATPYSKLCGSAE
jgi:hypothetical protein